MANYEIYIANSGVPKTGLTPNFEYLKKRSDGNDVTPPAITEVGGGWYRYTHTVPANEEHLGVVDADPTNGQSLSNNDRYVPVYMTANDEDIDAKVSDILASLATMGNNVETIQDVVAPPGGPTTYGDGISFVTNPTPLPSKV